MPFGFSTFSSFGHDKTHLGWAAGLYGGYRFNSIFSAELSAKYGEMNLSAQDCCVERNYWLGSDGMLYNAGVLGMDSWEYANLKSHVRMGWYGARVNVNLLGLFHKTANSRWDLAVSPHIYAVTTKADIQTIADDAKVMKGSTNWHLGYGADLRFRKRKWKNKCKYCYQQPIFCCQIIYHIIHLFFIVKVRICLQLQDRYPP